MIGSADKISSEESGLSVRRQCELLEVPRSTHYYRQKSLRSKAVGKTSEESDEALKGRIEAVALEYPRYGYRRVTKELRNRHPKDSPSNHKKGGCSEFCVRPRRSNLDERSKVWVHKTTATVWV